MTTSDRAPLVAAPPPCVCWPRRCGPRLLRRALPLIALVACVTVLYFTYYLGRYHHLVAESLRRPPIAIRYTCEAGLTSASYETTLLDGRHQTDAKLKIEAKVLLFVETQYSATGKSLAALLSSMGLSYKMVTSTSLPTFTSLNRGKYSVIMFESYTKYLSMDSWNRAIVDKYCMEYNVGIVAFMPPHESNLHAAELGNSGLQIHTNLALHDARLNEKSPVLRIARSGQTVSGPVTGDSHTVFLHNHSSYEPVLTAAHRTSDSSSRDSIRHTLVLQDCGYHDGVRRILFGTGPRFWLVNVLLLDAVSYLSHGKLSADLQRYVLVDVDDIFVGKPGIRMTPSDVDAMLESQTRLREMVPGFTFNLGFCGRMLHTGSFIENAGDDTLLANSDKFWWFPHTWSHKQPHTFGNLSAIREQMTLNKKFAEKHHIPIRHQYAVAPHHSGVYPVNSNLYDAWRNVWDIRQTSTEEYPHLYPAGRRRGFVFKGLRVLPRQTCGLFTHTIFMDEYPGGRQVLDDKIEGGELFQTILTNPISIFMTHLSNYGNDRLGLYTFESVFRFVRCWTNLRLATEPPDKLADRYFELFPEQRAPVWGNPCHDKRHLSIWRLAELEGKAVCQRFPQLLVLGPQKTGTTALFTFLKLHPTLRASVPSPETFEEIQFFNGDRYLNGIDWYLGFFPVANNGSVYLFEKSATYFDGDQVPRRVHALLPNAKLIVILLSPATRAYSWYQHQRAHELPAALQNSFYDIITATNQSERHIRQLRNRCLEPGKYAGLLENWLRFFSSTQIHLVDGEELVSDPVSVMQKVQQFLQVSPVVDYNQLIEYDSEKRFYCEKLPGSGRTKCLGKGKGRHYEPMEERSAQFLKRYFWSHNIKLNKLLKRTGRKVPVWLVKELSELPTGV